jgi:CHAT domain-containing protein
VQTLDLRHVQLATLSACETGLGEVAGGEGILGLQRAFQMAGARTTVTSLWMVDDAQTRALMERFYRNLWEKKMTKLDSLREAQLWMLREGRPSPDREGQRGLVRSQPAAAKDERLSPFYWAAFVLSGDWR